MCIKLGHHSRVKGVHDHVGMFDQLTSKCLHVGCLKMTLGAPNLLLEFLCFFIATSNLTSQSNGVNVHIM